ncbi:MAG: hypothetical protein V4438_00410 [Patescibacteria group bacterium]
MFKENSFEQPAEIPPNPEEEIVFREKTPQELKALQKAIDEALEENKNPAE